MSIRWRPISECPPDLDLALVYATHAVEPKLTEGRGHKPMWPPEGVPIEDGDDRINVATRLREPWRLGPWSVESVHGHWYVLPTHFAFLEPPEA